MNEFMVDQCYGTTVIFLLLTMQAQKVTQLAKPTLDRHPRGITN